MRQMSIKAKVTLWYTCWMLVAVGLVVFSVFSLRTLMLYFSEKDLLSHTVDASLSAVSVEDGQLDLDGAFSFLQDGVYLSFYTADGVPLYGRVPKDFDSRLAFSADTVQEISAASTTWLVCDRLLQADSTQSFWVRGVIAQSDYRTPFQVMLYLVLSALPLLVLLAAGMGYQITKRAFQPVTQIVDAAAQISNGSDLTRRINLGPGEDEIHTLARAFDRMFDRLEQSFNAERQFTSDASHELRTPVAIILSQCEYALAHADTLPEAKQALTVTQEQAKKMSVLLQQLLFLARADQGRQPIQMETLCLSEIALVVADELHLSAAEKQITIETDIQPDVMLCADETLMMRFFINLLSNAIAYGKPGGRVLLRLQATPEQVTGSVQDDGIGISEADLPRIWNRFYQVDPAHAAEQSSGLGLAMVKWIAELHQGTVRVQSRLGVGSTFSFSFPIFKK